MFGQAGFLWNLDLAYVNFVAIFFVFDPFFS